MLECAGASFGIAGKKAQAIFRDLDPAVFRGPELPIGGLKLGTNLHILFKSGVGYQGGNGQQYE